MNDHTFLAIWEITDEEMTLSQLRAEACAVLDRMAAESGARIAGEPQWQICGDRLICTAPARVWDLQVDWGIAQVEDGLASVIELRGRQGRTVTPELKAEIARLAGLGYSMTKISDLLHVDWSTAKRHATPEEAAA